MSHTLLIFFQGVCFPGKCFVLQNAPHMNGILPWQKLEENGGSFPLCPWIVLGLDDFIFRVLALHSEADLHL